MASADDALRGMALREAKGALRGRMLAARDAMPGAERTAASTAISARMLTLPSWQAAKCVLLTLAFRSEYDPRALIDDTLAAGRILALPRVDTVRRMLVLHRVVDLAREIAQGYRAIPEPLPDTPVLDPVTVDWVLVPGVAFDRQGRRLGYGGGFYDRLLPSLKPGVQRVAGIFALQLVDAVPAAPHDATVHAGVTEHATLATPAPPIV
jgi:5-formyltetrahydrofolate cyclo-ligase